MYCVSHISFEVFEVLKGMNLDFLVVFFFVYVGRCDSYLFFINRAARSAISGTHCQHKPNNSTLEIGRCVRAYIHCAGCMGCVFVFPVACWVSGPVQPQAVCACPVPSSPVQAAKAPVLRAASSCHMAAPTGTRAGQDRPPHGCFN